MKVFSIYAILILFILTLTTSVFAVVEERNLVGWWLFNDVSEETSNWGDIVFRGAEIKDGQLVCSRHNWANSIEYSGPDITELSLVSWVSLDDLEHRSGSALTLDRTDVDQFVAIVYAERQPRQWMPGSSHFLRTNDFPNIVNEDKTGEMVLLVITYEDIGNKYRVTGYRNDKSLGSFDTRDNGAVMDLRTWTDENAEAVWGSRHSGGVAGIVNDSLSAHIEESRIYNIPLTHNDVKAIYNGDLSVEPRDKLATRWANLKR